MSYESKGLCVVKSTPFGECEPVFTAIGGNKGEEWPLCVHHRPENCLGCPGLGRQAKISLPETTSNPWVPVLIRLGQELQLAENNTALPLVVWVFYPRKRKNRIHRWWRDVRDRALVSALANPCILVCKECVVIRIIWCMRASIRLWFN